MARPADVAATTFKDKKLPKVLSHLEVAEGENGGHVITHHHTHFEHPPEQHVFGKGQSMEAHQHIAKAVAMPLTNEQDGSEA